MKNLIRKYFSMSYKDRTLFNTRISLVVNALMCLIKFILAFFFGFFFIVAGIINVFMFISKFECYLGIKYPNKKSFRYRNTLIGIFFILAGLQYAIYMARLLFIDTSSSHYDLTIACIIAGFSFFELGLAIKGCFNAYNKGHYYRNVKMINLCTAFFAIALTEVALLSLQTHNTVNVNEINGWFGIGIGIITILLGCFVFVAPNVSIIDREHNIYRLIEGKQNKTYTNNDIVHIKLTNSKIYGNFSYNGVYYNGIIDGHIKKHKSPILDYPVWLLIILIILSEILLFVYGIGALIFYFKNAHIINKLDKLMLEKGFAKIKEEEQENIDFVQESKE